MRVCVCKILINRPSACAFTKPVHLDRTLCNGAQFAFLLRAELQHCVNDGQKGLPLAAGLQEDELQQDVLQILQVGHALLPLLVTF